MYMITMEEQIICTVNNIDDAKSIIKNITENNPTAINIFYTYMEPINTPILFYWSVRYYVRNKEWYSAIPFPVVDTSGAAINWEGHVKEKITHNEEQFFHVQVFAYTAEEAIAKSEKMRLAANA